MPVAIAEIIGAVALAVTGIRRKFISAVQVKTDGCAFDCAMVDIKRLCLLETLFRRRPVLQTKASFSEIGVDRRVARVCTNNTEKKLLALIWPTTSEGKRGAGLAGFTVKGRGAGAVGDPCLRLFEAIAV